jgi:hypothetical protein
MRQRSRYSAASPYPPKPDDPARSHPGPASPPPWHEVAHRRPGEARLFRREEDPRPLRTVARFDATIPESFGDLDRLYFIRADNRSRRRHANRRQTLWPMPPKRVCARRCSRKLLKPSGSGGAQRIIRHTLNLRASAADSAALAWPMELLRAPLKWCR